jgi:hypothetical protein
VKNKTIVCLRLASNPDRIENIIQQRFGSGIDISVISRTDLVGLSPLQAARKLRTVPGDLFCIACEAIEKRPRLAVLKAMLLISGKSQAYIIDEFNNIISKSWVGFLMVDLPKVIWELTVSLAVIGLWFVLLHLLRLWVK